MKRLPKLSLIYFALLLLTGMGACSDDDTDGPAASSNEVKIVQTNNLGNVLQDGEGYTLYFFTKDSKGQSVCEGACLGVWPIYHSDNLTVGAGLSSSDFEEITRGDGEKQTTYKGWPLYYYSPSGDGTLEAPGATSGENVNSVWFVAKPDYAIMLANAQLIGHDGKNYTGTFVEGTEETQYLVDGEGRTLYIFENDKKNTNNFTAEDLSNNAVWPIFHADLGSVPSSLTLSDFGTITVHGQSQLTYKGWPLYYFGQDAERGDNKGISFPFPGVWPVVTSSTTEAVE
jgi:predicted lipoprotein with Yx(FWY)xxD motif